ncbi:cytochrome c-type biogenesis protein CcmH [soil metagenome]
MRRLALALALASLASSAFAAITPEELLADPAEEARARAIISELRCVVCQGQALDESNAEIARDLRILVRELVTEGRSDGEVTAYLVARYGEFVLYRPPFSLANAPLWLAGPAFLIIGGGLAFAFVRSRGQAPAPARPPLTPDEERRLARLLEER